MSARLFLFATIVLIMPGGCKDPGKDVFRTDESSPSVSQSTRPTHAGDVTHVQGSADSWSRLYGDNGDCRAVDDGLRLTENSAPNIVWSRSVGTGYGAPVIRNGSLFLLHRKGEAEVLSCMTSSTGEDQWEQTYPTSFKCDYPTYSSGPYSTPLINGEAVFVLSAEGTIRAFSFAEGSPIWERDLTAEFGVPTLGYGVGHSPILAGSRIIVNVGGTGENNAVVAVDPNTGDSIWHGGTLHAKRSNGSYGTPVVATIHGQELVLVVTPEGLMCLRQEDGSELWSIPLATKSRDTPNSTTPVVVGDLVMCSMFRADAFCVRVKPDGTHEEVWQNRRSLETCYNPLTSVNGFVYGWHAFDRTFRCVELATGKVRWKQRTIFERGNHIAVGNHFLILGELGHVGCARITATDYDLVFCSAEPLLDEPCYTSPAYAEQRLYVRNEKQLLCLTFPEPSDADVSQ